MKTLNLMTMLMAVVVMAIGGAAVASRRTVVTQAEVDRAIDARLYEMLVKLNTAKNR
ncbi:MAG: hypothetical protein JNG84_13015 [Archangium sp.]|nr:hypothetical protein [Archangium sp.]